MYVIINKNGKYLKGLITYGYMNSWTYNIKDAKTTHLDWHAKIIAKRVKGKVKLI